MLLSERLRLLAEDTSILPLDSMPNLQVLLFTFVNPMAADDSIAESISSIESYFMGNGLVANYRAIWVLEPDVSTSVIGYDCGLFAPVTHVICYPDGRIADFYVGDFEPDKLNYIVGEDEQ